MRMVGVKPIAQGIIDQKYKKNAVNEDGKYMEDNVIEISEDFEPKSNLIPPGRRYQAFVFGPFYFRRS